MENKLSNFFPFSPESNLCSSFLLCIDDGAFSGACAFHELLFKLLKDGKKLHIISVAHSRSHYEAVLRKQALDLRQLELAGRITFQFPIVSFRTSDPNSTTKEGTYSWDDVVLWQKAGMPFHVPTSSEQSLQEETTTTATASSSSSSSAALNNEYVLCIDDLEALEVLAPDAQASRTFLSYILMHIKPIIITESNTTINTTTKFTNSSAITTVIAYGRQNPYSSSSSQQSPIRLGNITSFSSGYGENIFFPSCLHGSLYDPGHDRTAGFEPMLSEYLRYRADTTIRIQPLTSGYSSEVHGIITITVHSSLQGTISLSEQEGSQSNHGTRTIPTNIGIRDNKVSAAGMGTLVLHYKALDTGIRCTLSSKK